MCWAIPESLRPSCGARTCQLGTQEQSEPSPSFSTDSELQEHGDWLGDLSTNALDAG